MMLDVAGITKVGRSSERNDELEEKRDWEEGGEVLSKVGTGLEPDGMYEGMNEDEVLVFEEVMESGLDLAPVD